MLASALAQLTLVAQGGLLHGGGVVVPDPQRAVTLQHVQLPKKNYYYNHDNKIVIKGEHIKRIVTLQHVQLQKKNYHYNETVIKGENIKRTVTFATCSAGKDYKGDSQTTYISAVGRSVGVGQELSKLGQQILLVLEQLGHLGVNLRLSQRLTRRGDNPLQWSTQLI